MVFKEPLPTCDLMMNLLKSNACRYSRRSSIQQMFLILTDPFLELFWDVPAELSLGLNLKRLIPNLISVTFIFLFRKTEIIILPQRVVTKNKMLPVLISFGLYCSCLYSQHPPLNSV